MPDDLNNKMDEMLRDYARRRRNLPDPQMHPATRNMLQGEVARVYKKNQKAGFLARMRRFWPQYAIGFAAVVILLALIVPGQLAPSKTRQKGEQPGPTDAGEKESIAEAKATIRPESVPALQPPITEEIRLQDENLQLKDKETQKGIASAAAPAGAATAANTRNYNILSESPRREDATKQEADNRLRSVDSIAKKQDDLYAKEPALAQKNSVNAPPPTTLATTPLAERSQDLARVAKPLSVIAPSPEKRLLSASAVSRANELTNLGDAMRLKFVQVPTIQSVQMVTATGGTAAAAIPVLASFQLEQLGEKLRFVDRDGSVYDGQMITNDAEAEEVKSQILIQTSVPAVRSRAARASGIVNTVAQQQAPLIQNSAANYFRASGTNRTLGKDVIISGQLLERTNFTPAQETALGYRFQQNSPGRNVQTQNAANAQFRDQNQAQRAIVGTAVIGSTNQVPFQAISND